MILAGKTDEPADASAAARILLAARDFEGAADLFEAAYLASSGSDLQSLFYQAVALLELGDTVGAERRARLALENTDDYELKRRAYTLMARALHLRGESETALPMLLTLAELNDPDLVEPETLVLLAEVRFALEQTADVDLLDTLHPQSVAAEIRVNDQLSRAVLPSYLSSRLDAVAVEEPDEGAPRVSSIQVGSFADAENAMHLADDLRELSIPASVTTTERDGRELSLVVIELASGDADEVSATIASLESAGYAGFLIY